MKSRAEYLSGESRVLMALRIQPERMLPRYTRICVSIITVVLWVVSGALSVVRVGNGLRCDITCVPAGVLMAAICSSLILILVWFVRASPFRSGVCQCGYDLRGNQSGICPECGTQIDRASRNLRLR